MQNEDQKKTKWALSLIAIIVLIPVLIIIATISHYDKSTIVINNQVLNIEIANTSQERSRGLCCRDSLSDDQGMLFVYDKPGFYGFWMKDTRIPLDMIWINSNKQIVHIKEDVKPETYPKSFVSDEPAQYVLETNAGFVSKYQIKKRDKVAF